MKIIYEGLCIIRANNCYLQNESQDNSSTGAVENKQKEQENFNFGFLPEECVTLPGVPTRQNVFWKQKVQDQGKN